jgi:hypothetical protein
MQTDPRLGSCSGKPFYRRADRRVPEPCDDEIPVGMTKFYRTACFRDVGGFVREVMWDGIDSHRCRMRGWIARSFADAELAFEHLRQMGSSQRSLLAGRRRHGFGQYYMGTGWAYVLASALRRLAQPPLVLGSLAMLCGYGASWLARRPRYGDEEFRRFLRRYQWRCLVSGKRRALQRCEAEQAPVWRAHWATEGDGRSQRAG